MEELTREELERYDRQLRIWGEEAQLKLKKASILIVGLGGLGSPAAIYLAAAGVGRLILVDDEIVELSNLNRQILYDETDIGKPKVDVAVKKLNKLNRNVEIIAFKDKLTEENAEQLISMADIVLDGTDNWKTRFIINKTCVKLGKTYVYAGVEGLYGQLMIIKPGEGPCLNCIIPKPPPEKECIPALGSAVAVVSLLEVNEAIKLITNIGKPAIGYMLIYDAIEQSINKIKVKKRENCSICGKQTF